MDSESDKGPMTQLNSFSACDVNLPSSWWRLIPTGKSVKQRKVPREKERQKSWNVVRRGQEKKKPAKGGMPGGARPQRFWVIKPRFYTFGQEGGFNGELISSQTDVGTWEGLKIPSVNSWSQKFIWRVALFHMFDPMVWWNRMQTHSNWVIHMKLFYKLFISLIWHIQIKFIKFR